MFFLCRTELISEKSGALVTQGKSNGKKSLYLNKKYINV